MGGSTASLLIRQLGRCTACGAYLLHTDQGPKSPQEWEQWTSTITRAMRRNALTIGVPDGDQATPRLIHTYCRGRDNNQSSRTRESASRPMGLA